MAGMRGDDRGPETMFSYVSAEQRVPKEHPLRAIRALVDDVLRDMSREFDGLYARVGRPSIPPERLLRAQLLQIFYSIRSERLLMEQLDYNLLFRWFVAMASAIRPCRFSISRCPRYASRDSAPFDLRYNRASGSVFDACVSFFRLWPRKLRPSSSAPPSFR